MVERHEQEEAPLERSRFGLGLAGFTIVAGYFLWTEHEAHVKAFIPYLPFLLLLACPLMHLFMHRGHGLHNATRTGRPDGGGRKSEKSDRGGS